MTKNTSQIILTEENFREEVLQCQMSVLVEISAEWSGGCQIMAPIIEKLVDKYEERVKIARLDFNGYGNILKEYSVHELPVFIFFDNGQVVDLIMGAVPSEILEACIDEVLNKKKEV